jgi:hypothetical protein
VRSSKSLFTKFMRGAESRQLGPNASKPAGATICAQLVGRIQGRIGDGPLRALFRFRRPEACSWRLETKTAA